MSEHLSQQTLERLARRELRGRELTDALRHAGTCEQCKPRGEALAEIEQRALRAIDADAPFEHLDFDAHVVLYVEGKLDGAQLEVVESHLEDCASCRGDVEDLRAFRAALESQGSPDREPSPRFDWRWIAAVAAAAGVIALLVMVWSRNGVRPRPDRPSVPVIDRRAPVPPTTTQPRETPRYANAEWARLVDAAIASRELPFPNDLADLAPPPDELRNLEDGTATGRLAPAGVVIREQRPRFSWLARQGATYVVSVYAGDMEVAHSETLRVAHWTPSRDLPRGKTYAWKVEITRNGETVLVPAPPAAPAMFRITSEADERAIAEAFAAHPKDDLLRAVLLARAGVRDEAERAWERARSGGDPRLR